MAQPVGSAWRVVRVSGLGLRMPVEAVVNRVSLGGAHPAYVGHTDARGGLRLDWAPSPAPTPQEWQDHCLMIGRALPCHLPSPATLAMLRRCAAGLVVVACLSASTASTAAPAMASQLVRCNEDSNIDGDHISAANEFRVSGISCGYAFYVAAGLTDSSAREKVKESGTQTFTTAQRGLRYLWRCRETNLEPPHVEKPGESGTNPEEPGEHYRCRGRAERDGHRTGEVSLTFAWWLIGVQECPRFALTQPGFIATEITVSRNVTCNEAKRWIMRATTEILALGSPPRHQNQEARHRYYDSGRLYKCLVAADTMFIGEHDTSNWLCEPPGDPFAGQTYRWSRQPSNCKPCEGFTHGSSANRAFRPLQYRFR